MIPIWSMASLESKRREDFAALGYYPVDPYEAASYITTHALEPGQYLSDDSIYAQPMQGRIWHNAHTAVAATLTYSAPTEKTLTLWAIGVDRNRRRRGIATQVILRLEKDAQNELYDAFKVESVGSEALKHTLRTLGYTETKDGPWSTFSAPAQPVPLARSGGSRS